MDTELHVIIASATALVLTTFQYMQMNSNISCSLGEQHGLVCYLMKPLAICGRLGDRFDQAGLQFVQIWPSGT